MGTPDHQEGGRFLCLKRDLQICVLTFATCRAYSELDSVEYWDPYFDLEVDFLIKVYPEQFQPDCPLFAVLSSGPIGTTRIFLNEFKLILLAFNVPELRLLRGLASFDANMSVFSEYNMSNHLFLLLVECFIRTGGVDFNF